MYRLVLYSLLALMAVAVLLSLFGATSFSATQLIFSAAILFITCYGSNYLLSNIFNAPTNVESSTITAFILLFILSPFNDLQQIFTLIIAGLIAMASKYIFVWHKKHIFNPAAIAAVILGIMGSPQVSWWIATPMMLPLTLIAGLLIVRKIRRFHLFFSFVITSIIIVTGLGMLEKRVLTELWIEIITSWPIIFLATIMLTEPQTTPPTKKWQMMYGAIIGVLFNTPYQLGPIYSTPEMAIVVGNIFSFIVSPKEKLFLKFKRQNQIAENTYEYIFEPDHKPTYLPGQYLEWTLPHPHADSRGNRRYFTIASSPTESEIKLGVRTNTPPSSYKHALAELKEGSILVASQLAGDFTLPKNKEEKLVFIAGGIGITPFRSMLKYLLDTNEKRDIVVLYANKVEEEIAYKELFTEIQQTLGIKIIPILSDKENVPSTWTGKVGRIDESMLREEIPDYQTRTFYLSGPISMVNTYKQLLGKLGVKPNHIVTDYFPGF